MIYRNMQKYLKTVMTSAVLAVFSLFLTEEVCADTDTVYVAGDSIPEKSNLNDAVESVSSSGKLSSTVFALKLNSHYILNRSMIVPAGEKLTIIAPEPASTQEAAPPQILWSDWWEISNWPDVPADYFLIRVYGDLEMKNIWVYFADTSGIQMGTPIVFDSDTSGLSEDMPDHGIFDNCIFDFMPLPWSTASGAICVRSKHFNGVFRNCYFRNCTDRTYTFYGRAVSFPFDVPGFHIDRIIFENCTFANMGYVYQQENGNYADQVQFNHCTFLNIVMHSLESGWWHKMSVTNSLWVNGYMLGDIPAYTYEGDSNGGTIRIDSIKTFGFEVPFSEQDRRILFAHNSYFIEDWLVDWMANNEYSKELQNTEYEDLIPVPQPMLSPKTRAFFDSDLFPYMNAAGLHESANPEFILAPSDTAKIKFYLYINWCCGQDSLWAWHPEYSKQYLWPLRETLAYSNDTLLTAAMGGFPLGDLYHWFPEKYKKWEAQEQKENARINHWLETGKDPGTVGINELEIAELPRYKLCQGFPNPFNPNTQIRYSIPRPCRITLKVYNVRGQMVMTLFDGFRQPGDYTVTFTASGLSSGLYFCQMRTEEYVETKKLVLLK